MYLSLVEMFSYMLDICYNQVKIHFIQLIFILTWLLLLLTRLIFILTRLLFVIYWL